MNSRNVQPVISLFSSAVGRVGTTLLTTATLTALTVASTGIERADAQDRSPSIPFSQDASQIMAAQVTFNPPRGNAPRETRGGASRGDSCLLTDNGGMGRPVAIAPENAYGLTVSGHPTLMAFVPEDAGRQVFFTLKDDDNGVLYQAIVPLETDRGVFQFTLPESAPSLEIGKNYQWGIALLCDGQLAPDSPFTTSWIRRVSADRLPSPQSSAEISLEHANLYGSHGLWYDTISILAALRHEQPEDATVTHAWHHLLESVGLGAIASETL